MIVWERLDWTQYLSSRPHRVGIRIRFDREVDPIVKNSISTFIKWTKEVYTFPLRVIVYVKSTERIKAKDGEMVCGTFFRPDDYGVEPYIRVATGDYGLLAKSVGMDNALARILETLAHEMTHYYQYVNKVNLSYRGEEIQASKTASIVLDLFSQTRDHPWTGRAWTGPEK